MLFTSFQTQVKMYKLVKMSQWYQVTAINFILPSNSKFECDFKFTKHLRGTKHSIYHLSNKSNLNLDKPNSFQVAWIWMNICKCVKTLLMNIYSKKRIDYWVQIFGIQSLFVSVWFKLDTDWILQLPKCDENIYQSNSCHARKFHKRKSCSARMKGRYFLPRPVL